MKKVKEASEVNRVEKRLSKLKEKLEGRIERTDRAMVEAKKVGEELRELNKSTG